MIMISIEIINKDQIIDYQHEINLQTDKSLT